MKSEFPGIVDSKLWEVVVDSAELRSALNALSLQSQRAIFLRFWGLASIEEVACDLKISWNEANRCIEEALKTLRKHLPVKPLLKAPAPAA